MKGLPISSLVFLGAALLVFSGCAGTTESEPPDESNAPFAETNAEESPDRAAREEPARVEPGRLAPTMVDGVNPECLSRYCRAERP